MSSVCWPLLLKSIGLFSYLIALEVNTLFVFCSVSTVIQSAVNCPIQSDGGVVVEGDGKLDPPPPVLIDPLSANALVINAVYWTVDQKNGGSVSARHNAIVTETAVISDGDVLGSKHSKLSGCRHKDGAGVSGSLLCVCVCVPYNKGVGTDFPDVDIYSSEPESKVRSCHNLIVSQQRIIYFICSSHQTGYGIMNRHFVFCFKSNSSQLVVFQGSPDSNIYIYIYIYTLWRSLSD